MSDRFNFSAFLSTLAACMVLAFGWGSFCATNNINPVLQGIVSFSIGLFGSQVIYNWLNTPGKEDKQSESSEE